MKKSTALTSEILPLSAVRVKETVDKEEAVNVGYMSYIRGW